MSAEDANSLLRALLEFLRTSRGFDLSVYKVTTLTRRISKRLQAVGAADYKEYIDYLEVHPEEFTALFNTILINVTSFFRDAAAWDFLRSDLVPRIVSGKEGDAAIRVWSAGCSSGEEAYSLAMVFYEALGANDFRRRVKIYATDIDEEALAQARQGRYRRTDLEAVPKDFMDQYFDADGSGFVVKADLRRSVVFGRHDLVQDAPISRMDLLVCRNTLMYFNAEIQGRVLSRFHFALNENGFLFLGKAEMAMVMARLFAPLDIRLRIFQKVPLPDRLERPILLGQAGELPARDDILLWQRLRDAALDTQPIPQVVLDAEGHVTMINDLARSVFGLGPKDLEQPFQNLELSYRPAELRSVIQKVRTDRQTLGVKDVTYSPKEGVVLYLDVEVKPLLGDDKRLVGISISFSDATRIHQMQHEIDHSRQEQETANEELQSANEELQTTNEELQSTVEELQTTNEELQSTNEEMETMNEELQSTNEELRTANDQLRQRTEDLDVANSYMGTILGTVNVGIISVDPEFRIALWNKGAKRMWGLDTEEVKGKLLGELDIGLPLEKLIGPIRSAISAGGSPKKIWLNGVDRRGKSFKCRITITPNSGPNREARGAVLVMEEE